MNRKKQKRRTHRKFVRAQKQLVRNRQRKHKPKKWYTIKIDLAELDKENVEKLHAFARERKISIQRALRIILKKYMEKVNKNGIQGENS